MTYLSKTKNKLVNLIFLYWLPVFLWAAIIFTFSAFPTGTASEIDWQDFFVKKTAHIVVYFVLSTLTYRALLKQGIEKRKAALISIVFSIIYGFSDEFHQSFTPGRDPRLRDVVFDTIGAVLAIHIIWNILPKMPKRLRGWAKELGLT